MAMASWVPSLRRSAQAETQGLGLLPHLRVIPHFDAFSARVPNLVDRFVVASEPLATVVGIDEQTALVGGPEDWVVEGRGSAWIITPEGVQEAPSGTAVTTPSPAGRHAGI
jgi:hypothetical protein